MTREEAIKEIEILKEDYWDDDGYGHETEQYNDTMLALDMAIKALDQEPKTGHWILLDECVNSGYYCSECHKKVVKEGWSDTVKKIKYCPNCGVKMESEDKE